MNERLIVNNFGPVKKLDIRFKKVTLFIGDQGTGKSCVAKLFSMFKWLEKDLLMKRHTVSYYLKDDKFATVLCPYHRIESFIKDNTEIRYEGELFTFRYSNRTLQIEDNHSENVHLSKVIYVPAERSILSVAENRQRLIKELPDSCATFSEELNNAKDAYRTGYDLPFGNLHYKYSSLNNVSYIWGDEYAYDPVLLRNASSGIQSALPLCLVSDYLSEKVRLQEDVKLSPKEQKKFDEEVAEIMNNDNYSKSVRESRLKLLSAKTSYGSFINVVEEPELNLFPQSQMDVICRLAADNATSARNMMVLTTHSPYMLAIINTLILAGKTCDLGDEEISKSVEKVLPHKCHVSSSDVAAYRLSIGNEPYCRSIIDQHTSMIGTNDLDSASDIIMRKFNTIYRLYGKAKK